MKICEICFQPGFVEPSRVDVGDAFGLGDDTHVLSPLSRETLRAKS